jgi:hypothetical protein
MTQLSPFGFLALLLAALALIALAAAIASGSFDTRAQNRYRHLLQRLSRPDEVLAAQLGMSIRVWFAIRAGAAVAAFGAGFIAGSIPLGLAGIVLAWIGVPWYMRLRADRRQLRVSEALFAWLNQVTNARRAAASRSLPSILADRAADPGLLLREILAPLTSQQGTLRDRLVEVARRAHSPLCDQMVIALIVARDYAPQEFVRLVDEQLNPTMQQDLELMRRNRTIVVQEYTTVLIVCGLMTAMLLFLIRADAYRSFYSSPGGLVVLAAVSTFVALVVWWIGNIVKPARWVQWDVDGLTRRLEELSARV